MELANLTYKGKIRNAEEARGFYAAHNRRQLTIEKHFVPKMFAALKEQITTFINAINTHGYDYAKARIDSIVPIAPVALVVKDIYHRSAYIESNYVLNYLNRQKDFSMELRVKRSGAGGHGASFGLSLDSLAPIIDQYFEIYLLNISALPITSTTKKIIVDHLFAEVNAGKDLQTALNDFTDLAITGGKSKAIIRAVSIAKGESTRAMSFGGIIGAYMSGIDVEKVWVTSRDELVRGLPGDRFSHRVLDLNKAEMIGRFYNGEYINFPGDPEASIGNTINCRCAMYFRQKARPKPTIARTLLNFLTDFLGRVNLNFLS